MSNIIIKKSGSSFPEYAQIWQLREEMLRKPLGLSLKNEDLSDDALDIIFIALDNENVIGCVMMHALPNNVIKLRQMAVYEAWQGKGIGQMLVKEAEKYSWQNGYEKIVLHARQHAIGFYQHLGYIIVSDLFTEVSIPHVAMEKLKTDIR
jgi:N-acetylglutamate synthase-like GNAT family acetyltransferase